MGIPALHPCTAPSRSPLCDSHSPHSQGSQLLFGQPGPGLTRNGLPSNSITTCLKELQPQGRNRHAHGLLQCRAEDNRRPSHEILGSVWAASFWGNVLLELPLEFVAGGDETKGVQGRAHAELRAGRLLIAAGQARPWAGQCRARLNRPELEGPLREGPLRD